MPKNQDKNKQSDLHIPVLLSEVLQILQPKAEQSYLDLTAGYGGHASSVLELTGRPSAAVLVDRDVSAVEALKKRFGEDPEIIHLDFLQASRQLAEQGKRFDMILADLGTSSPHFDNSERGFAFSVPGPLDMRMDRDQQLTAADLVNKSSEAELVDILRRYGEEPRASKIARAIVGSRPLDSTDQLAKIIAQAKHSGRFKSKIHPATKSFQALRIAVNDELAQLEMSLPVWIELLAPGGKLAIISFHSLEDRIVKQFLSERAGNTYDAELSLLTKKPITASDNETGFNPRARSAKLRAVAKIKTNRKE